MEEEEEEEFNDDDLDLDPWDDADFFDEPQAIADEHEKNTQPPQRAIEDELNFDDTIYEVEDFSEIWNFETIDPSNIPEGMDVPRPVEKEAQARIDQLEKVLAAKIALINTLDNCTAVPYPIRLNGLHSVFRSKECPPVTFVGKFGSDRTVPYF